MKGRPAVLAMNYYRSAGSILAAANGVASYNHFQGQASGHNDLGSGGYLPDDRSGELTAVMFRLKDPTLDGVTAGTGMTTRLAAMRSWAAALETWELAVQVNNVEIIRGALCDFPHPPVWLQGGFSQGTAADNSTVHIQNAGYMLASIAHPILPRQTVKIVVRNPAGVTATDVTADMDYYVVIQVADRKPIAV